MRVVTVATRTELVVLLWGEGGCAQLCQHGGRCLEGVHETIGVLERNNQGVY